MKHLKNQKAFTLIELLSTIIILALLMAIAIPSISKYIDNSKKRVYVLAAEQYADATMKKLSNLDYSFYDQDTTYYIHINNIESERASMSPYGEWIDAYVAVIFDGLHHYHWVSVDSAGRKVDVTEVEEMRLSDIYSSTDLTVNNRQPIDFRTKIVIIDADGNRIDTTPILAVKRPEADECYVYNIDGSDNAIIIDYKASCPKDLIIPSYIDGHKVVSIYDYAFNSSNITSVVLPETVKSIGSRSFANNKISSVYLPSSIETISSNAFLNNRISSINFPEGLKTISNSAFKTNLISELNLPASLTTLGACAFCDNPIPNPAFLYAVSGGVTDYSTVRGYIGDFSEFSNKRFVIPASANGVALRSIAASAFASSGLTNWEVVIPNTVISIGNSAFNAAKIGKVNLPEGLKTIGSSAFYNNNLAEINIPSSVTSIGSLAFNTNKVTNPDQMWIYRRTSSGIDYSTIIGYAGANRRNVQIPATKNSVALKTFGSNAMNYLSLTGGITIPSTVTTIPINSFSLNRLTYVDNGDGDKTGPFIYFRDPSKANGFDKTKLLSYASGANAANVPSHVKEIMSYAFYYSNITSVTLPEGLTTIGSYSFNKCKLNHFTVPSTVTSIGTAALTKVIVYSPYNSNLNEIVNKTGRSFNWQLITGAPSAATFVTGTIPNWYGDIEVVAN